MDSVDWEGKGEKEIKADAQISALGNWTLPFFVLHQLLRNNKRKVGIMKTMASVADLLSFR